MMDAYVRKDTGGREAVCFGRAWKLEWMGL